MMDGERPIETAPVDDPERVLLLFCPEQGGWHTGIFWEGCWRLHFDVEAVLVPTHWKEAPAAREDAEWDLIRSRHPELRAH